MPPLICAIPTSVDSLASHPWLFSKQSAAFSSSGFAFTKESVSSYISPWFVAQNIDDNSFKQYVCVEDPNITACFLNQALDYTQRAMCNLLGVFYLASNGLETWSKVTNYYSSYFGVLALLCLQGKTFTSLDIGGDTRVYVFAIDLERHQFCFTKKGLGKNPHHQTPWRKFYEIYDRYALTNAIYEPITRRSYILDPIDESVERNLLNYTPFVGFEEIRSLSHHNTCLYEYGQYATQIGSNANLINLLQDLNSYSTDPAFKFYARAVLKIAFLAELFHSLGTTTFTLQASWNSIKLLWMNLMSSLSLSAENCYLPSLVSLIK